MIGRAAYHRPRFLSELEQNLYDTDFRIDESAIFDRYVAYMSAQLNQGDQAQCPDETPVHCFNGRPGARRYRQILSDSKRLNANDFNLVHEAHSALGLHTAQTEVGLNAG